MVEERVRRLEDRQFWTSVILLGLIASALILLWMFNSNLYETQLIVKKIWDALPKINGMLIS